MCQVYTNLNPFTSVSQGDLPNGPAKFHVLFLMFVALMFFVSLMFLFSYHCWLVAKNRSTLGTAFIIILFFFTFKFPFPQMSPM